MSPVYGAALQPFVFFFESCDPLQEFVRREFLETLVHRYLARLHSVHALPMLLFYALDAG